MRYYILLPDDTNGEENYSTNILGEVSFKTFWADQGFDVFEKMVYTYPNPLDMITIKDETNKEYTVEEFLNKISNLKINRIN